MSELTRLLDEIESLVSAKDQDYGGSWKARGLHGVLFRLYSKMDRLNSLTWDKKEKTIALKQARVSDETLRDTLLDMAVYCLMAIVLLEEDSEKNEMRLAERSV